MNPPLSGPHQARRVRQHRLIALAILGLVLASPGTTLGDTGGTINFRNRVLPTLDAPVYGPDGVTLLEGPGFLAALYAAADPGGSNLVSVGEACPFRTGAGAGYWNPGTSSLRVIPFVEAGQPAWIQVRVWMATAGATFEEALAAGGWTTVSGILQVVTGGSGDPPTFPADLLGLVFVSSPELGPPRFAEQPQSTTVLEGRGLILRCVAVGAGPIHFLWWFNGAAIPEARTNELILPAVQLTDAGDYTVHAFNDYGATTSSVARVTVVPAQPAGLIEFTNYRPDAGLDAPVYDDGTNRLAGTNFLAQLWAGPSGINLRAVGDPVPFLTGDRAGYFQAPAGTWREIPDVPPGSPAYVQLRVWEAAYGTNYEEAATSGGRIGASTIFLVTTGGGGVDPALLTGLRSFQLGALPRLVIDSPVVSFIEGTTGTLEVAVSGSGPWQTQWYHNGVAIPGATGTNLVFSNISAAEQGEYLLAVTNPYGISWSPVIVVTVTPPPAGGTVNFANRVIGFNGFDVNAPVFDIDGVTPLEGTAFQAQLYAGPSAEALTPIGAPTPFRSGDGAGYWMPAGREIGTVSAGATAFVQARVWEVAYGATFEAASLAPACRFGQSAVISVATGGSGSPPALPVDLVGLASFALERRPLLLGALPVRVLFAGESLTYALEVQSATPVTLQWLWSGLAIPGATTDHLVLGPLTPDQTGRYSLVASNHAGAVESAAGLLTVLVPPSGASLRFSNFLPGSGLDAPVFAEDGQTRLSGSRYLAQLYVGPDTNQLAVVGDPAPFLSGDLAGYFDGGPERWRILDGYQPGDHVMAQVRVWDSAFGDSYDEALATGGATGKSQPFEVTVGGPGYALAWPAPLSGLNSFALETPVPFIAVGPQGVTLAAGGTLRLEVQVTNTIGVQYTWEFAPSADQWQVLTVSSLATLLIQPVSIMHSGWYRVLVSNSAGAAQSPAVEVVIYRADERGLVAFTNYRPDDGLDAPVYDIDGTTRLAGTNFLAQLWGGPTTNSLQAVGDPVPFLTGDLAGYLDVPAGSWREILSVAPRAQACVQLRVWESAYGTNYEDAVALGATFGTSEILPILTGGAGNSPALLTGLQSFQLGVLPRVIVANPYHWLLEGATATLEVAVSGPGPWELQWYQAELPIPGATNATLVLTNLTWAEGGAYVARVANSAGVSISPLIYLTVAHQGGGGTVNFSNVPSSGANAPVFDIDGVTRIEGSQFLAQLYAGPLPTVLLPVGTPSTFRSGAGAGYWYSTSYTLNNVAPGATAFVQVRVWEAAYGDTFESASLQSQCRFGQSGIIAVLTGGAGEPPSLPSNLMGLGAFTLERRPLVSGTLPDLVAFAGETVTYSLQVQSETPVTLQWLHAGVVVPGATTDHLTLGPLQPDQAGWYSLLASNRAGAVQSAAGQLAVLSPPTGASVRFSNVHPGSGLDAPVFAEDGRTRLSGPRYLAQLYVGPDTNQLAAVGEPAPFLSGDRAGYFDAGAEPWRVLEGYQPGDRVTAQIRVWDGAFGNSYEEALAAGGPAGTSDAFVVTAGGPGYAVAWPAPLTGLQSFSLRSPVPVIAWGPEDAAVSAGGILYLNVLVTNTANPNYTWEYAASAGDWHPVSTSTSPSLSIVTVSPANSGLYRVRVWNAAGAAYSEAAEVTVWPEESHEFGAVPGHVTLRVASAVTEGYRVEASTNLAEWTAVGESHAAGTRLRWVDLDAGGFLKRFYRLRSLASDEIVSVHPAGFVRLGIPSGFSMLSNPLQVPVSTVARLLTGLPEGTTGYAYDPATRQYSINTFEFGVWGQPDQPFEPGSGLLILNPSEDRYLVTIAGDVVHPAPRDLPIGWSIQAAAAPIEGPLDTALHFPAKHLDIVARLTPSGEFDIYIADGETWFPEAPVIPVGEAFWSWKTEVTPWTPTLPP